MRYGAWEEEGFKDDLQVLGPSNVKDGVTSTWNWEDSVKGKLQVEDQGACCGYDKFDLSIRHRSRGVNRQFEVRVRSSHRSMYHRFRDRGRRMRKDKTLVLVQLKLADEECSQYNPLYICYLIFFFNNLKVWPGSTHLRMMLFRNYLHSFY